MGAAAGTSSDQEHHRGDPGRFQRRRWRTAGLPRYHSGVTPGDPQAALVQEIRSEKASSLARATARLEAALVALERAPADAPALRRERLAEARERLWVVVIQREAMGLLRHDVVHEVLRVPAEVRRAMGPRPRRRAG